jgi:hypothetical protein
MTDHEPEPLSEEEEAYYAALAERLTAPDYEPTSAGPGFSGAAAAAHGRAMMLKEYGSEEALEAALRQAGRPRNGTEAKGPSPTVRARISEADFAAFTRLQQQTGRGQSALVREAVHLLLERYRLAG